MKPVRRVEKELTIDLPTSFLIYPAFYFVSEEQNYIWFNPDKVNQRALRCEETRKNYVSPGNSWEIYTVLRKEK